MHRLKNRAVEKIMLSNAFIDPDKVNSFMASYSSPKTFLTLRQQRVDKLKTSKGRAEIAKLLELDVKGNKIIYEFLYD